MFSSGKNLSCTKCYLLKEDLNFFQCGNKLSCDKSHFVVKAMEVKIVKEVKRIDGL